MCSALVLLWLIAVGLPVVQQALPPEAQAVLSHEYATLPIAHRHNLIIVSRKR